MFDARDRCDRALGRALHAGDLRSDFLGRAAGLPGESFYFTRDHREPAPSFTGARGLNRSIQRKQISLLGNVGNEFDDVTNTCGRFVQLLYRKIGGLHLIDRFGGDCIGLGHLPVNLIDRRR